MQSPGQQRFGSGVNGIPQLALSLGGSQLLVWPDPEGHRIGGLLSFRGGLPAEIALLISMEASAVVRRWLQPGGGALDQQRSGCNPQLLPALTPGNPIAFSRTNDQLPGLEEERPPEQSDADQGFDQTTKTAAGVSPAGGLHGVGH